MSAPRKVTLHTAAFFTCEDCGRDCFVRLISVSADEAANMGWETPEVSGVERHESFELSGSFEYMPEEVKCEHCGSEFETEPPEWAIPLEDE